MLLQVLDKTALWHKRLLVLTATVHDDLLQAFLTAGATAVISLAAQPESEGPSTAIVAYFKQFYTKLFDEGLPLAAALSLAGNIVLMSTELQECC